MGVLITIYVIGMLITAFLLIRAYLEEGVITIMDVILATFVIISSWLFCILYIFKDHLDSVIIWERKDVHKT